MSEREKAVKFEYVKLGAALMVPGDQPDGPGVPIEGNYVWGVKGVRPDGATYVLGVVQENPSVPGYFRAVAAPGDTFPAIDFKRGVWEMTPGRSGFLNKRTAAIWLLGAYDARQAWFTYSMENGDN